LNNATQSVGTLSSSFAATTGTQTQTITLNGTALTVNQASDATFGTGAVSTLTSSIAGTGSLIKQGSGILTLSSSNTYSGGTTVNNGTLQIGKDNALLTTGALTVNGGTFGLQSFNQTVGAFNQTGGDVTGTGTLTVSSFTSTGGNVSAKIAGTGATFSKNTTGTTTVTGTQAYTGATSVTSGTLVVNGDISSSSGVAVSSGATLGGSGKVGGISGAGTVGPGNSPGIMTASSVDLSTGLDFKFELTTATPTYSNATGSLNDVLHLNNVSTPISGTAAAGNIFDIYLGVATLSSQDFVGGIFTDKSSDFSLLVLSGTYNYYVLGNGSGTHAYNGSSYYTLGEYNTLLGAAWTVTASVAQVASANFADGTITNGFEQKFTTVVPEPSTYAMLMAGVLMLFVVVRRPRSGMA
jgi:autotransporter-associated beta strand protein